MKKYVKADSDMDTERLYRVYIDYPGNPVYTLATSRQLHKLQDHREIHSFKKVELIPIDEIDSWGVLNY